MAPRQRPTGFDTWHILPGQGVYNDPMSYDNDGSTQIKCYCTDIIAELTIEVLKGRPQDRPFFMMSHHEAPQREWMPDESSGNSLKNLLIPEPETLHDDAGRTDALYEQKQFVFRT